MTPARRHGASSAVWLDGRLVPADAPHLPVTDRGFQLGDGIFETLRARRGVPIELDEHFARLHESADALDLVLPWDDAALARGIGELLEAEALAADGRSGRPGDAALRITVSRGSTPGRGLVPLHFAALRPTVVIQAWPYRPPDAQVLGRGVRVVASSIRRDPGSPLAGVKTTSRADHVYARLEARRAGACDAIFLTTEGALSEATTANLFLLRGDDLLTPPTEAAILAGTTRAWLLAHAADLGLRAAEGQLWPDDLLAADEAFLCSSVAGLVPLTAYEGRPIGSGEPGARTLALREARERWIDEVSLSG